MHLSERLAPGGEALRGLPHGKGDSGLQRAAGHDAGETTVPSTVKVRASSALIPVSTTRAPSRPAARATLIKELPTWAFTTVKRRSDPGSPTRARKLADAGKQRRHDMRRAGAASIVPMSGMITMSSLIGMSGVDMLGPALRPARG